MLSQKNTSRILIADDDPVIRTLLASIATKEGYATIEVSDGREAFRRLQSDARFAAAIFDFHMPGLSGVDLVTHMATEKRLQRIPVMLITAETDVKVMSQVFAAGAVAYLPKPFTREQVETALRMLIGKRNAYPTPVAA